MGRFEAERMDERSLLPADHVGPGTVQRGWCYGSSAFRAKLVGNFPVWRAESPSRRACERRKLGSTKRKLS